MAKNQRIGVLLMSYGTPQSQKDILPFYTDVRRGRPPTPEQLAELSDRYALIGGLSPLTKRTLAQVKQITDRLNRLNPGKYRVRYATKHSKPTIEEAVKDFAEEGISSVIGMVFAPHYSKLSVGQYMERVEKAASCYGIECRFIKSFAVDKALIGFLSGQILSQIIMRAAEMKRPENGGAASPGQQSPNRLAVLITAHSLPTDVLAMGDVYVEELRSTARAIAGTLGLGAEFSFTPLREMAENREVNIGTLSQQFYEYKDRTDIEVGWQTAWQSAGRTSQTWLGPDILEVIRETGERGIKNIIVCPAGFMSDHLEILYDIDIAAQNLAAELFVSLSRTQSVNDNTAVMDSLAQLIYETGH